MSSVARLVCMMMVTLVISFVVAQRVEATPPPRLTPAIQAAFQQTLTGDPTSPIVAPTRLQSWLSSRGTEVIVHWGGCGGDEGDFTNFEEGDFISQLLDAGFTTMRCQNTEHGNLASRWNLAEGFRINASGRRVH